MLGLGKQWAIDYYGCEPSILNDVDAIRLHLIETIREANGTIVTDVFHRFNPYGISGVVVIAESHVAIHTWPEFGCAAIDLFSCSPRLDSEHIMSALKKRFKASDFVETSTDRGLRARPATPR